MDTTATDLESNAFNFSEFIHSGVDARTGSYSTNISLLAGWRANNGDGPQLPLSISFDSFRTADVGWGRGWTLSLSSYNQRTRKLTLASGVSYRVYISGTRVVVRDKKLQNTQVAMQDDKLIVSHKNGLIEILSRPDETYDEWLPERIDANEGRSVSLVYGLAKGRRVLLEVRDQYHRAVVLNYATEDQPASITLWPDHRQRRLKFVSHVLNGWLRKITLDHGAAQPLSWTFDYQKINGFVVIKEVTTPGGSTEQIKYSSSGHRLPLGAPITSVPKISRSILAPGAGMPTITRDYEYSDNNFLGYQSGLRWAQDGDHLHLHRGTYTYSSTERLVTVVGGETVEQSRIKRTYNRFHLMIMEEAVCKTMVHKKTITYHDVDGKDFFDQPAQFQLQKTAVVSYEDTSTDNGPRTETTHTTYDEFGNLLTQINPSGAREDYVYYPAQGAEGCPANALGFIAALKERSVTPSPDFGTAPTVIVRFTYVDLPSVRDGGHRFLLPSSEKLFEGDNETPCMDTRYEYIDDAGDVFHGRLKSRSLTEHVDKRRFEFAYSINGDLVETRQRLQVAGHHHDRKVWHDRLTGQEVKVSDGAGNELVKQYDRLNRVVQETAVCAGTQVSGETNTLSRTSVFHDSDPAAEVGGPSVTITSVRGVLSKKWVDGLGRTVKTQVQDVDAPGKPMRLNYEAAYDHHGRLLSEDSHDWSDGKKTTSTTRYTYDSWGRLCRTVGPDGVAMNDLFDPVSLTRTGWIDGAGKTRSVLNMFGKPDRVERINSDGLITITAAFTYDGLGRCLTQTNEAGFQTCFSYDLLGRVVETVLPDGTSIKKKYSPQSAGDHPIEISANDYVLGTRDYDGLLRVIRTTVGGRTEKKSYEGEFAQPSEQVTAAGEVLTFTLDPSLGGRVTERSGLNALSATYRFDPGTAQPVQISSPVVQRRLEYTRSGKLQSQVWASSGGSFSTVTSRSLNGLLTGFTDVNGITSTYVYDNAARPVEIHQGPVVTTYTYGDQGDLLSLSLNDTISKRSLTTTLTHDEFGREVRRISEFGDGTRLEIHQAFSAGDKLQQRTLISGEASRTETFAYDNRGRLIRYDCEGTQAPIDAWGQRMTSQVFTYDYLDNLLTVCTGFEGGENVCTFSYERADKTQLSSLTHSHPRYQPGQVNFDYDANGNLLNDEQGRSFRYDALSRLESVTGAGVAAHYQFDGEDQLHAVARESGALTRLFYNGHELCNEVEGDLRRSLLQSHGMTLAEQQDDEVVLFATDGQGTVLERVRPGRDSTLSHAPYGDRPPSSGLGSLQGFQGERLDPSTGCYLLGRGYRAYNPRLMRFHTPDSWSPFDDGGINAYAYCLGDPVNLKDPTGHISTLGWVKIGVAAALAVATVALTVATLGATAPLVPITVGSWVYATLEVVSAVVSVASTVASEIAPDSLVADTLFYASIALGVVSFGNTTASLVAKRGIGLALNKAVNSLDAAATVQRGAARVAVGRRLYGAASTANEAVRNTSILQSRLRNVLVGKTSISVASVLPKIVFGIVDSDKHAAKTDALLQENWPTLADSFSAQELQKEVADAVESFIHDLGNQLATLRAE